MAFSFYSCPRIVSALRCVRTDLGRVLSADLRCAGGGVALVTDKGVRDAGLVEPALLSLKEAGLTDVRLFDDVVADPPDTVVQEAVDMARADGGVKAVVGLGGGSSMDVAKLVALMAHPGQEQTLEEMYGVEQVTGQRLPLVQIPTTAGTGSEVTQYSIVTMTGGESEKKAVAAMRLLPDVALLDGTLTLSMPPHVTAATGIDAMVHGVEAFTCRRFKNPLSDVLAKEAVHLLSQNIHRAVHHGDDEEARGNMLLGSLIAGLAFNNAPVGAVHALAYPLGVHFHVPHGLANSLMLPHVLRYNCEGAKEEIDTWNAGTNLEGVHIPDLYAELASIIFPDRAKGLTSSEELAEALAAGFTDLPEELNIPSKLRDVGVSEGDLELLATDGVKAERILPNNPREIAEVATTRALYSQAY